MPELKSKAKVSLHEKRSKAKPLSWSIVVLKSNMLFRFQGEEVVDEISKNAWSLFFFLEYHWVDMSSGRLYHQSPSTPRQIQMVAEKCYRNHFDRWTRPIFRWACQDVLFVLCPWPGDGTMVPCIEKGIGINGSGAFPRSHLSACYLPSSCIHYNRRICLSLISCNLNIGTSISFLQMSSRALAM